MKSFFKILRFAGPYWVYALLNVLFNIFSVLFSLVSFALFIPVLQMLFHQMAIPKSAPPLHMEIDAIKDNFYFYSGRMLEKYGNEKMLIYIGIIIIILYFLKNFFRYLAMYFLAVVRNGVVKDLRNSLYKKILILPLSYFNEKRKGDIIARMTNDVQEVEWSIMSSLEMAFRDPITMLTYLITLFVISPSLTLFVLILLPISGLIIGRIGKSLKRTSDKGQKKMGYILSMIEETISGLRIIKAFNAINFANNRFQKTNDDYNRLMIRLYRKRDLASPLSEFLSACVVTLVLWYGGKLVFTPGNYLDAAAFIVYLGIFSQLIPPAKSITQAFYNIQKGAASIDRIETILAEPEVIEEKPDAIRKNDFLHEIEYRDTGFSYSKEPVLKNVSMTVPKGKMIALVGPSGGGKSTMVDLLPRFYDCKTGKILIDGIDIRDLVIRDLRGLMGIVSQETILFNDSVFNNIAFGMGNVSYEEVVNAAKVANAHEFIERMPLEYETNIGDRGTKLSGGQRQRLSIARAVLKNPPILILDEATSALDTESERLVQQALENLMMNRTSIVIAHRLSTIQYADEIIVIQQGEIVERGTHFNLLEQNGVYRKLYDLQSFV
ncbi:MAG: ABC transporter ATP-binding protein [Bacteroidales bacterium]|nr:ABC transporter ATP-binding protein/permease [Bacteroidales bacterium]MDD4603516.1 ABC transporter ATP-binding protein [Bacteroidales bacterium]